MLQIEGIIEKGALVEGAAKTLFGGKFDNNSWMMWLPDDGRELTFKSGDIYYEEGLLALIRYGNKTISVWKVIDGVLEPQVVFIPAKFGFGKNRIIPTASAYAEVVMQNAEASDILDFLPLPRRVLGFREADLPDVADLDQKALAGMARSSDPSKMEAAYKKFKRSGDLVFVPESLLPADFVADYNQPWCLDLEGFIDSERYPVPQLVYQTSLTKHGLHYSAATNGARKVGGGPKTRKNGRP
jgi:hypothetical protein